MDAKDLRIETALGERNDGSKYSQSGVARQCNRNKSYQDIGSNPLVKAEVAVRPCAVIGPDRVVPPASNDPYLKKASVDLWSCTDTMYPRPPDYPHKPLNNVNPSRNISPRQTFQENMQRIMVPPTYSAVNHADEPNLNHVQDRNAALIKNTKQTMAPEAKYCDVPYSVNLLTNEHKNVRETDMCMPSVNSPLARTASHGWPPSGVNLHAPRSYGAHDVYQYPQFPSCAGPRPPIMPMARPHRTFQEDGSYVYPDPYYQDASVRFKPYPSVKERYPHARYDYISNYPNPFHPPPAYASHKYDIPNTRPPHPYPVYPHLKYLDNRVPDPNIEGYQRPNQQSINYNMPFRNQVIHPNYAPVIGNTQNKLPLYPPDKSSNKLPLDNSKAYIDYENSKAKYSLPDSFFVNEMSRVHQVQKPIALPNYTSSGIHPVPLQQYHRKDNMPMKTYEYMPHYRHFEHPLGFNHPPQFSPSTLAISPTDSNTSNDTSQTQGTSQEDCGYVSQSSTTSARSFDSNMNRLHNEYYRRYDYRYRPIIGNSHMLAKSDLTPANSKENNKIDVRQFLSMWNEGDEDSSNNNTKEISAPNNYRRQESAKSQDQLYVLGLVNVPSEELAKYEHIQKVSKLPENIKGYNSIELLNQFEEVIESSNMNSFKSSTSKEFMSMKDRKNAIKQIVEVLPRPVSPLDVEAKISQSVIHKEVGCNFEIKPCSPKMMNVEIAAPIQNILGERAIEKVSNPLSNNAKSPLTMRLDGNGTVYNNMQRQESTHTTFGNVSCKMIGSPCTANNMESVKTNYSLHDLETSSGVCLASLPRLDNEIELSFPEVNQQFINANKGSHNMHEKHPEDFGEDNLKSTTSTDNDRTGNDSEKYTNISVDNLCTELTKLSQYRKAKVNILEHPEDESNANAIRTDSVIIENPENVRKMEENREKISPHTNADEDENTPMNLTSQNSLHKEIESDTSKSSKTETHAMECALDFSLNKSENGLPLIDANDGELINTAQKDMHMGNGASGFNVGRDHIKPNFTEGAQPFKSSPEFASYESNTKSIIVRNKQSARSDHKINYKEDIQPGPNYPSLKIPKKSDEYVVNQVESKILCDIDDKRIGGIKFDDNKTRTKDKASFKKAIVSHKHKTKSKISKTKVKDIMPRSFDQNQRKNEKESSILDIHDNENHVVDSKRFERKSNDSKSVIQNKTIFDKNTGLEVFVSDICKDDVTKPDSAPNDLDECHKCIISENVVQIVEKKCINDAQPNSDLSVNEEAVNNYTKVITTSSETNDDTKINSNSLITDINLEINDTTPFICNKGEVFESNTEISKTNKYYHDLIAESELFVDKTYCMDAVSTSCSNSINNELNASIDVLKILDDSTKLNTGDFVEQNHDPTDAQVSDNHEIIKYGASATKEDIICHKVSPSELSENKICYIENNKPNVSFDDEVFNKSVEKTTSKFVKEKKTEKNESMSESGCDKNLIDALSEEIKIEDAMTTTVDNSAHNCAVTLDAKLKKYSIDSGFQSSKNSFVENDDGIIVFPGNSSEDSVFVEQGSGTNKITPNGYGDNNCDNKDILQLFSDESTSTRTPSNFVGTLMVENKTSEHSNQNNKMEIQSNTLQSSTVFDNVDANMEILFAQQNEEIISENSVDKIDYQLQSDEDLVMALKTSISKNKCIDVARDQTLEDTGNESYTNEHSINANKTMEMEDYSSVMQYKYQNNVTSNPLENIDIMDIDESCEKSFNKDEEDTNVPDTSFVKKHSGYHGKELYSPSIQKLIMFSEGKTNIQIVKGTDAINLQNDEFELNSLKTTIIDRENDDVKNKSLEKSDIDSIIQNNGVEAKSFDKRNIESVMQNSNVEVKSSKKLIIVSAIQNDGIEANSIEEPNIESTLQNDDVDELPELPNIVNVLENDDIEEKYIEPIMKSVIQNDKVEVKLFEIPINESVLHNTHVEVKSLQNQIIDSVMQNDNVEVKLLEPVNFGSVIQNDGVEDKSLANCVVSVLQNNVKSTQEPNIESYDPVSDVCPQSESALIQGVYINVDVEFEKRKSVTNTNNSKDLNESSFASSISIDSIHEMPYEEKTGKVNVVESILTERENNSDFENDCDCDVQNDLIDTQEISFNYPNNSIISQVTGNIFHTNDNTLELKCQNNHEKYDVKFEDTNTHCSPINHRQSLKRSFSDSDLNANVGRNDHTEGVGNLNYSWAPKRNKINDFDNYLPNNRRNSVNVEENVAFCILIDDNCIITEENEEKICIAELHEDYMTEIVEGNDSDNTDSMKEFHSSPHETDIDLTDSAILECEEENPIQGTWVEDITCAEDVFSDEVAENVVISAPSSPIDSASEFEYDESGIYGSTSSCSHTDKVKFIHGEKMSGADAQIVEALYRTPHMNIMNKTLLYGDKSVESDNDQENIILESDDYQPTQPSPIESPDYTDPTHASNDFRLETPENKENVFVKELSPLRRIDDYLDVSSAENETDEHCILPNHVTECNKTTQDGIVYVCESSLDTVFDYKIKNESVISTTTPSSSSSPEVSSTTSEEKNSGILLKITNLNGSRVSQINEIETNNRPRCKFTEKKDYSASNLNFPNGPLITKAAQKYIPPIKESVRDLKVKITLPQQSLLKLKRLKLSKRNEPKVHKQDKIAPRIAKKPKPNFDDVLKSIDELQIKRHKEKSKKTKTVVPKVLIKKNENGSHYASTPKRETFSPDLTGRKWQPWVFLEKNHFIDKMAIKNKTRAIFSHRKKTYVLAEKFKKYKSVGSAKFVISQPKTPGQLKYTIRLKHSF